MCTSGNHSLPILSMQSSSRDVLDHPVISFAQRLAQRICCRAKTNLLYGCTFSLTTESRPVNRCRAMRACHQSSFALRHTCKPRGQTTIPLE
jgi:hypothetical protein